MENDETEKGSKNRVSDSEEAYRIEKLEGIISRLLEDLQKFNQDIDKLREPMRE